MVKSLEESKEYLKGILVNHNTPVLFLGAGFSWGAENQASSMCGKGLKQYIFDNYIVDNIDKANCEEVSSYNLRQMCDTAYNLVAEKKIIHNDLKKLFEDTVPAEFHYHLTNYPWKEIYTVNIDDLIENVFDKNGKDLVVHNKRSMYIDDENNDCTHLFKLHGCVRNVDEGLVFSEDEYHELIAKSLDAKLNKLTNALLNKNIIFVGANFDEPDIKHYLKVYEDAGCKYLTNKLIFIDNNPSFYLKSTAKKLNATIVRATNKEFLEFVHSLNYNPNELNTAIIKLNYSGIYLLNEIQKVFKTPYESKLYEGYFCEWQDVYEDWPFKSRNYLEAVKSLNDLIGTDESIQCFSIYGTVFSGKSCLLKQLGYYLSTIGYEILEYRGKFLNFKALINYIKKSSNTHFAITIDNASHYYEKIEKIFSEDIGENKLVILTASRPYYHSKKKYYLDGNNYVEFKQIDDINKNDATIIRNKLEEKTRLSYMVSYDKNRQINEIRTVNSIANLIVKLTYGSVIERNKDNYRKTFNTLTDAERILLLELAIFDTADIEMYPRELFSERYGKSIALDSNISKDTMKIVDFVRMDTNGLSLRNAILESYILKSNKKDVSNQIIDILKYISRHVSEKRIDTWYIIFQCLLKEDVLEKKLNLNRNEIEKIYLSVKEEYQSISYYWLQLGLFKQKSKDFVAAYNYLEKSASIRPGSFKIQHAIARNFMRHANAMSTYEEAKKLFEKGEQGIKRLLESNTYNIEKARPYSVNSYIVEKVRFINKFKLSPEDGELKYMRDLIDGISIGDEHIMNTQRVFYSLLKKHKKLNLLKINLQSPYFKFIGKELLLKEEDLEYLPIVEDM